jgi:hypothetical protein
MIAFLNTSAAAAPLVIRAKPGLASFTPKVQASAGPASTVTLASQASRLSDRAHQDREIVYFPNDPSTHSFSLYHDYTESRPGVAHYFNVVRAGSSVSNPSAVLLDTGEALKVETISGAELKKRGLDAGEPVTDATQIVVISFAPVKAGQSVRLAHHGNVYGRQSLHARRRRAGVGSRVWPSAQRRRVAGGMDGRGELDAGNDHAGSRRPPALVLREQPERRDTGADSSPPRRSITVVEATTSLCCLLQHFDEQRLLRMQPVLGLIEHDRDR